QQRVAIARAMANKPAVILADEPTGNLDSKNTVEVMGLLKNSSWQYNQTILMVTHNENIAQTCDRILRIEDGVLIEGGEQNA
ncbi:MAG: ABC transporter ATP-binding protein, partial [Lachnospiraceae bacterium]|nr:ABC transporter ATP-binding protein [Lachnospiraceae bacterium]